MYLLSCPFFAPAFHSAGFHYHRMVELHGPCFGKIQQCKTHAYQQRFLRHVFQGTCKVLTELLMVVKVKAALGATALFYEFIHHYHQ